MVSSQTLLDRGPQHPVNGVNCSQVSGSDLTSCCSLLGSKPPSSQSSHRPLRRPRCSPHYPLAWRLFMVLLLQLIHHNLISVLNFVFAGTVGRPCRCSISSFSSASSLLPSLTIPSAAARITQRCLKTPSLSTGGRVRPFSRRGRRCIAS